jgi:hypothetical protein
MNDLAEYPLTGKAVGRRLLRALAPGALLVVSRVETLSDGETPSLGQLWRSVQAEACSLPVGELSAVLQGATQVVTLDVHLASNPAVSLLVEDGEVFSDNLG